MGNHVCILLLRSSTSRDIKKENLIDNAIEVLVRIRAIPCDASSLISILDSLLYKCINRIIFIIKEIHSLGSILFLLVEPTTYYYT